MAFVRYVKPAVFFISESASANPQLGGEKAGFARMREGYWDRMEDRRWESAKRAASSAVGAARSYIFLILL